MISTVVIVDDDSKDRQMISPIKILNKCKVFVMPVH